MEVYVLPFNGVDSIPLINQKYSVNSLQERFLTDDGRLVNVYVDFAEVLDNENKTVTDITLEEAESLRGSSPLAKGGIDLSPDNFAIKESGDEMVFGFTDHDSWSTLPSAIDGIQPVITNIISGINSQSLLRPASQ